MNVNLKKCFHLILVFGTVLYLSACAVVMADTEDVVTRSFNVSEGGKLTMDVSRASIDVETEKGNLVKVRVVLKAGTSDEDKAREVFEKYDIDFKHSGDDVTIKTDCPRHRGIFSWFGGNRLRVRFIVTVPEKYDLDLKTSGGSISISDIEGDVKSKTSGGSLKLEFVKGPVWGRTSGGSIRLEGCSGDARLRTSGGSIRIGKVEGTVNAHTSGGSVTVEEVMGTIDASTSGGSVSASISKQPEGDCSLKTSGGTVTVRLAKNIKVDVDAKTSGGRVHSDFPVTMEVRGEISKRKLQGKINGGGPELFLRTSGGSIKIKEI